VGEVDKSNLRGLNHPLAVFLPRFEAASLGFRMKKGVVWEASKVRKLLGQVAFFVALDLGLGVFLEGNFGLVENVGDDS